MDIYFTCFRRSLRIKNICYSSIGKLKYAASWGMGSASMVHNRSITRVTIAFFYWKSAFVCTPCSHDAALMDIMSKG